jgi:hypothetical protein
LFHEPIREQPEEGPGRALQEQKLPAFYRNVGGGTR